MRPPDSIPCIVCGHRRGHDGAEHERHRAERRRCANLLRRTWPRLAGLGALLEHYARGEAGRPAPAPRPAWGVKVLRDGSVVHRPIRPEVAP